MPDYPDNINVLKITNDEGLEYWVYPLRESQLEQEKPSSSIAPPGQSAADNIRMALQGQEGVIPINFVIWNDGEDRANETHSEPVVTVGEQVEYLKNHFHDPSFGVGFTVEQDNGYLETRLPSMSGNLENILIPMFNIQSSKWLEGCQLRIEEGENI